MTELTPEETENPLGGYGRTVSHVVIGLKTTRGGKQLRYVSVAIITESDFTLCESVRHVALSCVLGGVGGRTPEDRILLVFFFFFHSRWHGWEPCRATERWGCFVFPLERYSHQDSVSVKGG